MVNNLRICIVTTMFPRYRGDYYGSFVFDEAKALLDKGCEVHIVTQHNPNILYEEEIEGLHVHRFKWAEPKRFRALVHFKGFKDNLRLLTYVVSLFFKLIKIIVQYKIDIIHAHSTVPTGFLAVIVSKIVRIPSFVTAHGMDVNNFEKSQIFRYLIRVTMNNCNKAIAVSEDLALKMQLFEVDENNIVVLNNAINLKIFKPISNEEIRVKYNIKDQDILLLYVGYLDTFKGVFELMDAFFEIHKKNSKIKLLIVGEGPKRSELEEKSSKLKLNEFVIFTDKISHDEMHKYYQASDIFILPSYSEGLPLSILEAMACGIPVVASNVGGIPEIIKDYENGLLVNLKDKNDLYKKLRILINDIELREKFGKKSVELIKIQFDITKKIEKLMNLYNGIKL